MLVSQVMTPGKRCSEFTTILLNKWRIKHDNWGTKQQSQQGLQVFNFSAPVRFIPHMLYGIFTFTIPYL